MSLCGWFTLPLLEELERVMRKPRFAISEVEIEDFMAPLLAVAEIVVPMIKISAIPRCSGDNRVLEAAIEGACSFIVTGDRKDLLSLGSFGPVSITNPKRFLAILGA